jgi:hypothetical protein
MAKYGKRPPLDILQEAIELVAYPGLRIPNVVEPNPRRAHWNG